MTAGTEGTSATAPSGGSTSAAAAPEGDLPPDVKPVIPKEHFLERRDLSAEDKAKFFDRMAEQVCDFFVFLSFAIVAPEPASNHL